MMGDNRDNSTDSRDLSSVGYVPFENFVGRAEMIFFSIASARARLAALALARGCPLEPPLHDDPLTLYHFHRDHGIGRKSRPLEGRAALSASDEGAPRSSRARRAQRPRPGLDVLEARIGHHFHDTTLLPLALTHVSKAGHTGRVGSYQRLEFLVIACWGSRLPRASTPPSPRPRRVSCRAVSPASCGGRPAPPWPRPGRSAPISISPR